MNNLSLPDKGTASDDLAGNGADTSSLKASLAPPGGFRGDLVPPGRAAGAAFDQFHVVQAEGQQHGLFEPLIDLPRPVGVALGDAVAAIVKPRPRTLNRLPHRPGARPPQPVARVPRGLDPALHVGRHELPQGAGTYTTHTPTTEERKKN